MNSQENLGMLKKLNLQTLKPIAFDLSHDIEVTGRFVLIDNYEIVGGGIITESKVSKESVPNIYQDQRINRWEQSNISAIARAAKYHQKPIRVLVPFLDPTTRFLIHILHHQNHR